MTKWRVLLLVVLAAALALAFASFRTVVERPAPVTPTQFIPPTWSEARKSPMHEAHVGKRKSACAECHGAGSEAGSEARFDAPPDLAACARSDCHAEASARAHVGSTSQKTTCLTCHSFAATPTTTPCGGCHEKKPLDGGAAGVAANLAHHATPDAKCGACHKVHAAADAGRRKNGDCSGCHADAGDGHGAQARKEPDASLDPATCASCHGPHEGKAAATQRCVSCHAPTEARGPASARDGLAGQNAPRVLVANIGPRRHEACTSCHAPHDTKLEHIKPCAACHERQRGALRPGHDQCVGCHKPHENVDAARAACASCHTAKVALAAARVPEHARCESCHSPHAATPAKDACRRCHEPISHGVSHGKAGECIQCHVPHTAPPNQGAARASACVTCHKNVPAAAHAAKATCVGCHKPHGFGGLQVSATSCSGCHQEAAKAVRTGHGDCAKCHASVHTPKQTQPCGSCHKEEAKTAPKGHQRCESCHAPHQGSSPKVASCTGCHQKNGTGPHKNLAKGCATCHRPHGPKGVATPPACKTCHVQSTLPGLHQKPSHGASCERCHSSHEAPRADRASCTGGCHTDRRGHQPDAKVCNGCHIFSD